MLRRSRTATAGTVDLEPVLGPLGPVQDRLDAGEEIVLGAWDGCVLVARDPDGGTLRDDAWGEDVRAEVPFAGRAASSPARPAASPGDGATDGLAALDAVLAARRLPHPKGFVEAISGVDGALLGPRVGVYRLPAPGRGILGVLAEEPVGGGVHRFVLRSVASTADRLTGMLIDERARRRVGPEGSWSARVALLALRRGVVSHLELAGMNGGSGGEMGWFTVIDGQRHDIGQTSVEGFRALATRMLEDPASLFSGRPARS